MSFSRWAAKKIRCHGVLRGEDGGVEDRERAGLSEAWLPKLMCYHIVSHCLSSMSSCMYIDIYIYIILSII